MIPVADNFTEEEKRILSPYFTNLDKPVYAFTGRVPEEVVAVLFSKYSRSKHSLRRNFLKLVQDPDSGFASILESLGGGDDAGFAAALVKARDFFQRILVGYGDDSVGELGIAHVACEDVSNIATKRLEDARLTSPLEKSTRYVVYDPSMYYREPRIMASEFKDEYVALNELLLKTYGEQVEPMKDYVRRQWPIEEFDLFGKKIGEISDEKELKRAKTAYEAAVRAKALDVLRYYLPASTLTNVGITANGRGFEYLISKLMSDELEEIRIIGQQMYEELSKVIPSLVKRAKPSSYVMQTRKAMNNVAKSVLTNELPEASDSVTLIDYDAEGETKIVSAALYSFTHLSMRQVKSRVQSMTEKERFDVLEAYIGLRSNRREKPMRAAEAAYYTFDVLSDYGAYRDLQRHRMLTQITQSLTVNLGYDTPPELKDLGFEDRFHECMKAASGLYEKLHAVYPPEAQYVVPFAFKIRYLFIFNLREAFHLIELRSMPQGHPSYRRIVQEMYRQIKKVHPVFASYMRYVHLDDRDALGRLKGELRAQEKLAKLDGREIKA